jgi:CSLREA domain-containing protein
VRARGAIRLGVAAVAAVLLALALPGAAVPQQFNLVVDTTADGNDGECARDCTLREAVALANPSAGQWVSIPPGVYRLSQGPLVLQNNSIVFGVSFAGNNSFGARTTVIDARGTSRVFEVPAGSSAVLAGLTITGGNAPTGGGVFVANGGQLTLYDTILEGNVAASRGAGIDNAGNVSLFYSTVSGNRTTGGSGGGLAGEVDSNTGVFYATLSGNSASANGGGIVTGGSLQLQQTTIAANSAGAGGGLFQESTSGANTAMWSTILAGNSGGACGGSVAGVPRSIWSQNLADDATCQFTGTEGTAPVDPLLNALANNGGPTDTHAIRAGSPAINNADPNLCGAGSSTDQRHGTAVGPCDIGAFEFGAKPPEPQLPPPIPGETVNASLKSGIVKVKLQGSDEFFVLKDGQQVPVGTTFDTSKGKVTLVAAANQQGKTQKGWFYKGVFKLGQSKGKKPLTTLSMTGKLSCGGSASAAATKKKRRLWGDGKGRFRTKGKHSAATVVGTKWLVEDRCNGTLTKVLRGTVSVRDFKKRKTVRVTAGHQYFAKR